MITPGIDKYRLTHSEPFRTIVGYGFNDEHVQIKFIERCDRDSVPLVVLTKELTASAKAFLASGRCRRYLAIEGGRFRLRVRGRFLYRYVWGRSARPNHRRLYGFLLARL
ncbi:hypothetical protein [Bradyrhizobium sp. USDA 3315]